MSNTPIRNYGRGAPPNHGNAIVDRRLALGLSQKELADKAGVNRSLLSAMENGYEPPRSGAYEAVAEALGVPSPGTRSVYSVCTANVDTDRIPRARRGI